jgi:hypothetical protein
MIENQKATGNTTKATDGPKKDTDKIHASDDNGKRFLYAIKRYQERGIHVFPLNGEKIPIVEQWNDKYFEIKDFEGAKGVGSCPGLWSEPSMVFDADGPFGKKSLEILIDKHGPLPPTYSVETGREEGGEHRYYKTPAGLYVKSTASKIAHKVDIRGTRGQAVLPPTIHRSGKKYQWKYDGKPVDFVDPSMIPQLPDVWVQALIDADCAYYPEKNRQRAETKTTATSSAYGLRALEAEAEKVRSAPEKKRNDTLNIAALRLGGLVAGGELSQTLVESTLIDAALATGLGEREVMKTLKSGLEKGMQDPRSAPEKQGSEYRAATFATKDPDQKPEPLPDELLPVASFDFDLLPESVRPWAEDICDRMQCPPDFVAVGIMAALAGVIGRKVGIRPQARTDWTEFPNLWALIVGRPGVLKSPALEQALNPLKRLQAIEVESFRQAEKEHEAELVAVKLKKEAAEKRARDALKQNPDANLLEILMSPDVDTPTLKRFIANDTSPASLGELLRQNPNGLLVFRDEIIGLLKNLDREGQEEGRTFYLTAWNGNSPYTFDRIGRGLNLHIPAVCLSVLGGTQPGRLAEYIRHAVRGGDGDDGLIQRFGLLVWPDISGSWKNVDRFPDTKAKEQAQKVFDNLRSLDPHARKAEQDKTSENVSYGTPFLRFCPGGLEYFLEWRESLEKKLRGELHPALESHFAKYRKLIPAIALICHLADEGSGNVSEQATLKALAWGEYLETHAQRAYGSISQPEISVAKAILKRIKKGDLPLSFSSWEVWRPGWAKLTDREQVKEALRLLEDYGWITTERIENTGGRPKVIYHSHKEILS